MVNFLLAGVILAGPPAAPPADLPALEAMWRSQRTEVVSAKIRFRFMRDAGDFAQLSPEQVKAAFVAADMAASPDNMASFIKSIRGAAGTGRPWSVMEFLQEGKKTRERIVGDGSHDYVYDGESLSVVANAGRQVTVSDAGRAGNPGRIGFELFRPVPEPDAGLLVLGTGPGRVRVGGSGLEYVVNPSNELVESMSRSSRGVTETQILTAGAVTYPGGVTMPCAAAALSYSSGVLRRAEVEVIEEAEFNVRLPDDSFRLAAAGGTVIVDARYPEPRVGVASGPIRDVAGRVREGVKQPTVPLTPPGGRGYTWVWVAAGAVLVAGLVVVWRRRSAKSVRSSKV